MFSFFKSATPAITVNEALSRLNEASPPVFLDVREPDEYSAGHIPGSVLMPLGTVEARMGELERERPIVVVCRSGGRSDRATQVLRQAGLDAVNMTGGMLAWQGPVAY